MIWLLPTLAVLAVLVWLDRRARREGWRLGRWTTRVPWFRRSTVVVRGGTMRLDGWCENCHTGWRYALPHATFLRRSPSEPVVAIIVVCRKCRAELPLDVVVQRYAQWWVDRNEVLVAQEITPDPREFDDIKAALRVGG